MSTLLTNKKIAIIDYDIGNLFSISHAFKHLGFEPIVTSSGNEILKADMICLPGVGAFHHAMKNLYSLDLISPLTDFVQSNKPVLGICLGMQLLFSESTEFGNHKGLDFINGQVKKFPTTVEPVPQVGWNQLRPKKSQNWRSSSLQHTSSSDYFYFVHSYFVEAHDQEDIFAITDYCGISFCSAVQKNNLTAFQFHPEKSGENGLKILKNWVIQSNKEGKHD